MALAISPLAASPRWTRAETPVARARCGDSAGTSGRGFIGATASGCRGDTVEGKMMTSCLRLGLTLTTTRRSSATSRLVSVHANAPRPGGNGETRAPDPGAPGGPEKDEGEAFRRWGLRQEEPP